jgi:ABC-type phosphate transport system permease subunit
MAVLLVLSPANVASKAILGPNANGDVARQVAEYFPVSSVRGQSQLTLAALTLFATTLFFALVGRFIARRSGDAS